MPLISVVSQHFPLGKYLQKAGKCGYLLITGWWDVIREDFGVRWKGQATVLCFPGVTIWHSTSSEAVETQSEENSSWQRKNFSQRSESKPFCHIKFKCRTSGAEYLFVWIFDTLIFSYLIFKEMCTETFAVMCFDSQLHDPVSEPVQFCLSFTCIWLCRLQTKNYWLWLRDI